MSRIRRKRLDSTILTQNDIRDIKNLYSNTGKKPIEICSTYKIGMVRFYNIVDNKTNELGGFLNRKNVSGGSSEMEIKTPPLTPIQKPSSDLDIDLEAIEKECMDNLQKLDEQKMERQQWMMKNLNIDQEL